MAESTKQSRDVAGDCVRSVLVDIGFADVPTASGIAADPQWLLRLAACVVIRNISRLEGTSPKDCAKVLVDIASAGARSGAAGDGGSDVVEAIRVLLTSQPVESEPLDGSVIEVDDREQGVIEL